jgi:zinc protease
MRRFFAIAAIACATALAASSTAALAQDLAAPLPADAHVVRGQLPNGLRYIIRRNKKPDNRAELRLVVNAGSILEDDDQRGIAHFVEHMMFDGTKRFPKKEIVNYLERVGMRFGADLNAYTSFDETVYMLQIPTDTARLMNTALDILQDWASGGTTFDAAEMKKERGVVIEEWRTGRDASTRVQNRQFPVMLQGSKYAERVPIGTKESLETFADSLATKFYRDWYRPDLMTVIAVGDFDPVQMEASIRQRFAGIPMPASPRKREYAAVPDHDATLVSIETDKEYPQASVALLWFKPRDSVRTVADFRRTLVSSFYDNMVNARLAEITQRADAPFVYAGGGRGAFVRTKDVYQLAAGVKESGFERAAQALLAEAERIVRFGFTQTELDRQRTNLLRSVEQQYAERDKTVSSRFVDEYVSSTIWGTPIVGIEQEQVLMNALASTITVAEVNALSKTSFGDKDRVVLVAAPAKPDIHVPTAAAMLKVFDAAGAAVLSAYVDSSSDAALVPNRPTPGKIVSERTLPETGILEWTLSNGARVLLKPTDFKADELLFAARSPGGESILPDADVLNADLSSVMMARSGVGSFNAIALGKKLAGKKVNVAAGIDGDGEGVRGTASVQDAETMFQLVWLRITAPRVDTGAFLAFKEQMRAALANQKNDPESVFSDTVEATMSQHSPRVHLLSPALLDSVSMGRAFAIYRDRFADASGFTFFLVGSFKPDSMRPLVEQYLASLPSLERHEKVKDTGIRPPAGVLQRVVRKGVEPKAETTLIFTGPCTYNVANRYALDALTELLNIRLREVLREEKGGTYGANAGGSCSDIPYEHYNLSVDFGSAPERVDELIAAVFKVFDEIKAGTVSDSNLTKIREIELREHETGLKQNASWLNAMTDADEDHRDQRDYLRYPELVKGLSRDMLRDAAKLYLRSEQYARFTLLPETAAKPAPATPE